MSPAFGLGFAQSEPRADALHGVGVLTAFQRVAGTAVAQAPFSPRTESRDLEEVATPVRRSISTENRGSVQFGRSATGPERSSSATARKAASAYLGATRRNA